VARQSRKLPFVVGAGFDPIFIFSEADRKRIEGESESEANRKRIILINWQGIEQAYGKPLSAEVRKAVLGATQKLLPEEVEAARRLAESLERSHTDPVAKNSGKVS
jgi:hypothetical protein